MEALAMIKIWIQAARPKTLVTSLSPALIGGALAFSQGHFHPWIFLLTVLTGTLIQIGTNFSNDYSDFLKGADTSTRKGPIRLTQAGLIPLSTMKRATALVFALAATSGICLTIEGGWAIAAMLLLYIVLGAAYTSGPYPLAYLGLGEVFVLALYGPGAVACTYYLQTHTLPYTVLLAGLGPGAISSALILANNLRDIHQDREAGKKTLPVRFGMNFGRGLYIFFLLLSGVAAVLQHTYLPLLTLLAAVPILLTVIRYSDSDAYILVFKKTPPLLILYTLLYCYDVAYSSL
jgi:1,4-dihydroxy-2-naphthoate octaprenyltransferase